ncbi:MAG: hypothetical protein IT349_14155 [Candidatus Eisenbacteria bacterium]|nr:hypothetical protein [Candidatus Eisenbacteria bacterium]
MPSRRRFRRPSDSIWNRPIPVVSGLDLFLFVPLLLSVTVATPVHGATFESAALWPAAEVEAFTPRVAQAGWSRQLLGDAWSAVVIAHTDLYDRFPYVEQRSFMVVSDPAWNRLLTGEERGGLRAFDGAGTTCGPLSAPRGLAVDALDHVYVCDTDNDRIVVLRAHTEFAEISLEPLFVIDDLRGPHAVAHSDGGTPFQPEDDRLYVAETGRNCVAAFRLGDRSATCFARVGELGSGAGSFAGPTAIALRREEGTVTHDLYVADAHNRRIVHLRDDGDRLTWVGAEQHGLGVVATLEADAWGNLHAVSPQSGRITRLNGALESVASLPAAMAHPRSLHLVNEVVTDHRSGARYLQFTPRAIATDEWTGDGGITLWNLGLELSATVDESGRLRLDLSDAAEVTVRGSGGTPLLELRLEAGGHRFALPRREDGQEIDPSELSVVARSRYEGGVSVSTRVMPVESGGLSLLGAMPNPLRDGTEIRLEGVAPGMRPEVRIHDVGGRLIRVLDAEPTGVGRVTIHWDGRDQRGHPVGSGLYLYRVTVGADERSGRLVVMR